MQLQGSEERAHLLFENVTEVKLMWSVVWWLFCWRWRPWFVFCLWSFYLAGETGEGFE